MAFAIQLNTRQEMTYENVGKSFFICLSSFICLAFHLAVYAHCIDHIHNFTKCFYICCQSHQCEQITIPSISNQTSKERERERERENIFQTFFRVSKIKRKISRQCNKTEALRLSSEDESMFKRGEEEKRRRKKKREKVVYSCSSFS